MRTPIPAILFLAAALAACGENVEQKAASGGLGGVAVGAAVGGPVGAAVGAGVGAAAGTGTEYAEERTKAGRHSQTGAAPAETRR